VYSTFCCANDEDAVDNRKKESKKKDFIPRAL
jgi:hypothetical protein